MYICGHRDQHLTLPLSGRPSLPGNCMDKHTCTYQVIRMESSDGVPSPDGVPLSDSPWSVAGLSLQQLLQNLSEEWKNIYIVTILIQCNTCITLRYIRIYTYTSKAYTVHIHVHVHVVGTIINFRSQQLSIPLKHVNIHVQAQWLSSLSYLVDESTSKEEIQWGGIPSNKLWNELPTIWQRLHIEGEKTEEKCAHTALKVGPHIYVYTCTRPNKQIRLDVSYVYAYIFTMYVYMDVLFLTIPS